MTSTGQNAISRVIQRQASAAEDEFCLLWFAYLDTRVLCVGMGVCAGSRFKRHGTNRTLVKDFTVTTLNVRFEGRHVRVHNIAVHAAAERAEESQCSPAPSSAGHHQHRFSSTGKRETHMDKTTLLCQFKNQHNQRFVDHKVRGKKFHTFSFENLRDVRSERVFML